MCCVAGGGVEREVCRALTTSSGFGCVSCPRGRRLACACICQRYIDVSSRVRQWGSRLLMAVVEPVGEVLVEQRGKRKPSFLPTHNSPELFTQRIVNPAHAWCCTLSAVRP